MELFEEIFKALQIGNIKVVQTKTQEALDNGMEPNEILNKALIASMEVVGENFKNGDIFLPEVMMSAKAMQVALNCLKPKLVETGVKPIGKVVIGTVKGDQHDIGKNLVSMMMTGAGIEVIDLGTDVSVDKFISAVRENQPQVVALSALLTTTMNQQRLVIEKLVKEGLREKVKVVIGGAPVTESFAKEIGAEGKEFDKINEIGLNQFKRLYIKVNG